MQKSFQYYLPDDRHACYFNYSTECKNIFLFIEFCRMIIVDKRK